MNTNNPSQSKVIEAEILDENGQPIAFAQAPRAHGDVYGRVGFLTGFFALIFSFVMILLGTLVTIFILTPLLLLGRLLGLRIKHFRR